MKKLTGWTQNLLELFFPHLCVGCGAIVASQEQYLCSRCRLSWPVTGFGNIRENPVARIFYGRTEIRNATAYCYFTKKSAVQEMLHLLKYKDDRNVATYIANMMTPELENSPFYKDIDLIVPVPMHPVKEKIRGYNQAALIADAIARKWKQVSSVNLLIKQTQSESQTHKSRWERWRNMESRFCLKEPELVKNKHVLLIDDVITTGATMEACAQLIGQGSPASVNIAGFAWAATTL